MKEKWYTHAEHVGRQIRFKSFCSHPFVKLFCAKKGKQNHMTLHFYSSGMHVVQ